MERNEKAANKDTREFKANKPAQGIPGTQPAELGTARSAAVFGGPEPPTLRLAGLGSI